MRTTLNSFKIRGRSRHIRNRQNRERRRNRPHTIRRQTVYRHTRAFGRLREHLAVKRWQAADIQSVTFGNNGGIGAVGGRTGRWKIDKRNTEINGQSLHKVARNGTDVVLNPFRAGYR